MINGILVIIALRELYGKIRIVCRYLSFWKEGVKPGGFPQAPPAPGAGRARAGKPSGSFADVLCELFPKLFWAP